MRPIDGDSLKRHVKAECNPYGKPTIGFEDGCKVLDMIDSEPTIDIYELKDASYTYYEIWNTTSERTSECTERCVTLETAKDHLASNHCDWCRPAGTGRIYGVTLTPTEDGSITKVMTTVYENN